MTAIRWNMPPHDTHGRTVDGPWGRYLVRRERPRERWFAVTLNGQRTVYGGPNMMDAMKSVERVIVANFPEYSLEEVVRP